MLWVLFCHWSITLLELISGFSRGESSHPGAPGRSPLVLAEDTFDVEEDIL
jgi:hypothetical protein